MKKLSIKDVCEIIWEIEKKYDLFNKQIKDVYFWKLIRMPLFYEISKKINLYNQAHTEENWGIINKLLYIPKGFFNSFFYGPLRKDLKKDYLIFEHPRKVKNNNKFICKYTFDFVNDLNPNKFEVLDRIYSGKHFNNPSHNRSYIEKTSFIMPSLLKKIKINRFTLDSNKKDFLTLLQLEINSKFMIEVDLLEFVINEIIKFKSRYDYFNKLIKKRNPKKVYLVVSYGMESLIAACKANNVRVVEFQHGTMSKYHLGYSYPNNKEIPYFPDEIYFFGKYWSESTPLPLSKKNQINYGFPYLKKKLKKNYDKEKEKNKVIFISQGVIGEKMSRISYEFANDNPQIEVIYKLHPGEYNRWKKEYKALELAKRLENFKVIDNNSVDLYQLLYESEYQVGVFSTAIYEGLTLNCKTILLDLSGVEYMEYLIDKGIVKVAKDSKELSKHIQSDQFNFSLDKNYFFNLK